MTKEEAINVLNDYDINFERNTAEEIAEAHEMAIKVLEEQPSEDCISRKAVLDALHRYFADGFDSDKWWNSTHVLDAVNRVPSATPQPKTGQPSEDCISRKLMHDMGATCIAAMNKDGDLVALGALDILPSVYTTKSKTGQPKTGHWIGHREHCEKLGVMSSGLAVYEWCSNCGHGIDIRDWYRISHNYCPECGSYNGGTK